MPTNTCAFCAVTFEATPKDPAKKRQGYLLRFCSVACRNRHNTKQLRTAEPQRFLPDPDPSSFQQPCELCGKVFDATPANRRYMRPLRYCSSTCRNAGRGQKVRRRVEKTCKHCGKMFEILRSWENKKEKHTGQFCSHQCHYAYGRENVVRRQSPKNAGQFNINRQGYAVAYRPYYRFSVEARQNGEKSRYAQGRILEHRIVMEELLGRRLHVWETVHHKNGKRADNDPSNLELWIKTQPTGVRLADIAEIYGAELLAARRRLQHLEAQLSPRPA